MLDIAIIKEKPEELHFEFAGEVVKGKVYPYKVTPDYLSGLQKLSKKADPPPEGEEAPPEKRVQNSDAQMISELIPEWDVVAGGEPFPPSMENLLGAPISFLAATALAILELVGKLSTTSGSKS
jgi:hypothetical protein